MQLWGMSSFIEDLYYIRLLELSLILKCYTLTSSSSISALIIKRLPLLRILLQHVSVNLCTNFISEPSLKAMLRYGKLSKPDLKNKK